MILTYNNLTYYEVLDIMMTNPLMFNNYMKEVTKKYNTVFWECVPISYNELNKVFQFVILDAPSLSNIRQDNITFSEYFQANNSMAVQFLSKGGDSWLVSPRYVSGKDFSSLSRFINNASESYIMCFWCCVANTLKSKLLSNKSKKFWLSTSGLGVNYLHVRIDERPKYYNFDLFKEM